MSSATNQDRQLIPLPPPTDEASQLVPLPPAPDAPRQLAPQEPAADELRQLVAAPVEVRLVKCEGYISGKDTRMMAELAKHERSVSHWISIGGHLPGPQNYDLSLTDNGIRLVARGKVGCRQV